jgi:hypothetical protein
MNISEFLNKYGSPYLVNEEEIEYNSKFQVREINQSNKEKLRYNIILI